MGYEVLILPRAKKELASMSPVEYPRLRDAIWELADNPRPHGTKKLIGRPGWRLRVGSYRIIYEIDDARRTVTILHLGDRRDVYR